MLVNCGDSAVDWCTLGSGDASAPAQNGWQRERERGEGAGGDERPAKEEASKQRPKEQKSRKKEKGAVRPSKIELESAASKKPSSSGKCSYRSR